jgi:hypothetical protein
MASSRSGSSLWVRAWLRAVSLPAWRRAAAVWAALAIIAGIVMGPTGLMPRDVVELLSLQLGAALLLGGLWLALLHPVARILVRAEAALFLRSLPAPPIAPALPLLSLLGMQLPPPLLFAAGGRPALGALVWLGLTAASYALAHLSLPRRAPQPLAWRGPLHGLGAILASRLFLDDALLRALAFAGIGGVGAGLMIRNNQLLGGAASTLGLGTLIMLGTPAWAAVTQPLAVAHRRLWPLCASTGMPAGIWVAALAGVLGAVMAVLFAAASIIAGLIAGLGAEDVARLAGGGVILGAVAGVAAVRVAEWATRGRQVAERVLTGSLLVAATLALMLGLFGEVTLLAAPPLALAALLRTREPVLA